jgi:hypothetical protein
MCVSDLRQVILRTLKICYMPVFCLFTLGRHGNFTAGVTLEQPDLLCTALRVVEYYPNIQWINDGTQFCVCRA